MQTFVQPRLVKIASTGANARPMQATSASGPTTKKKLGSHFLPVLLSALSMWAA
jgi:hypothetical protein